MSRKLITTALPSPSLKDENGAYLPLPAVTPLTAREEASGIEQDLSIDSLLHRSLVTVDRMLKAITIQASEGTWDRESVQNLKDLTSMLLEFKKKEAEILEQMSDETIEKLIK